ncbi:hypothetical protein HU200_020988 [Digitaria exilis]|uniref:Spindle and kinetochore-associated protein 3 n=1 Tax=Digitaria exilis TaxID=1010633 RepID=A0A835KDP3_9POAL|nr:hypothetical protein HU200_020988 [Digitaria exilis]
MERSISSLCASLSSVLDHADSSSRELADLVSRRPIHLGNLHPRLSSGPTGTRKLNRLAEAANAEVEHLESMVLGAVSFEELLGHCGEALNVYARHHEDIESRLVSFGYEPPKLDSEVQDGDIGKPGDPANGCFSVSSSVLKSSRGRFGNDNDAPYPFFGISFVWKTLVSGIRFGESLKSLGFSDACLATLSSEGTQVTDYGEKQQELYKNPESADEGKKIMKEAELIAPQSKSNDQGEQHECLGCFKDRSNLIHSDLFAAD